eukprot:gb/GECH01012486.1/.p1 GENE.gb/GECH01012486.1/~~gb/GECH01012486.1/.p1  ORF type:complete len:482 (+),score=103.06 gb/GECH01012486.1/:1-1446(+)
MATQVDSIFQKPDFNGYLKKKGAGWTAWRERWFELRGRHLYYFKPRDTRALKKKPAGVIDLTGATVAEASGRKNGFSISGPKCPRTYELAADDEDSMRGWMDVLKASISKVPEEERENARKASSAEQTKQIDQQNATVLYADRNQEKEGGSQEVGLKDFDLLTVIGRGSFGKVMKVRKKETGEIFAMKVLRKDMVIRENMVNHTKSEKNILQQIKHPFIVTLRYAFQTQEKLYLILDFLSGGELFHHLKEESHFTEERSRFYAAEIGLAIGHLHQHDIIYRDLKPENAVLDKHGHVCLTDFGLAKTSISAETPTYTFCGTPEYLAPEILKGQGHGKAVDWWSLGVLLYEMLVGIPPFYSENINEMYDLILKEPLTFPEHVSPEAQSLLRGLLERNASDRLGCQSFEDIKKHEFFRNIDWDALYNRKLTPPFVPQLTSEEDHSYFDEEFTQERARDSFAQAPAKDRDDFDGFTYSEDSALSK